MTDPIETRRRFYAEELRFTTRMRSARVQAAFATVPRERFVGDGPWRVKSLWNMADYWTTEDADPANVYHDILIALDEKLGLNNGQPSLWAFLFDRLGVSTGEQVLHLGSGTGYYTAILAELVGAEGSITALEIEPSMAERARPALAPWPQIALIHGDGAGGPFSPVDVIVASAGATHPLPIWIDALNPGGRLLFPMTVTRGPGAMLLVRRQNGDEFSAQFLCAAAFYEFSGARDPDVGSRLDQALTRDRGASIKSVRREPHAEDETCWLHGDGWCLSRREITAKANGS